MAAPGEKTEPDTPAPEARGVQSSSGGRGAAQRSFGNREASMRRRDLLGGALSLSGLLLHERASGQPDVAVGYLIQGNPNDIHGGAFRSQLCSLGWCGPRHARVMVRAAMGIEGLARAAAELLAANVKVIVTGGETATRIARAAPADVPIVFNYVPDPVGRGLVKSVARPDANLTGFALMVEPLLKCLEILRDLLPQVRNVAYLFDPTHIPVEILARQAAHHESVAASFGMRYSELRVRSRTDIEAEVGRARSDGVEAVIVEGSPVLVENRFVAARQVNLAKLPAIFRERQFASTEALITFGENFHELQRGAAEYVDRILRGASASELPVQHASKLELVLNLKTARTLGIAVPSVLLARADEVIELSLVAGIPWDRFAPQHAPARSSPSAGCDDTGRLRPAGRHQSRRRR